MGDSGKKKQEDALGTITQPAKCRACYHVMLSSDIVHCIKCSSGYHPLCAKNAGKLTNGAIQKCCGPKKNATVDDIKELLGRLRADINNDLQKTAENLRGSFEEATAKLGARIGAVEEKNTLIEKKVDDCQKNLEICTDSINVIGKKMQSLTSTEPNSQYACILSEVEERENRRKNVMVFDLAESTAATNAERVAHDNKAISNICAALDLSSAGFRSYRIELCADAGVLTLEERRSCAAILFVKNLFRGFVDCSKMLETVPINVPSRINRTKLLLRPKVSRTNFSQSSPLYRLIAVCNQIDQNGNCEVDILAYNQPLTSGVLASMITQYR
ncbi:hypothetical protein KQX54_010971 [Cotesia glomerata]|uniref:Zinc finger PHD-type domain-containing protein n=1 Tax=Cotesia glomerata TaxID=32391 RepID=A0AAV7HYJ8_COTGL|nr:hypothetical protein KQX54_010971 [Cotesia glomerata]